MKRITFTLLFVCCALALAAQDVIRVNYKGAKPTITDFAWAYLSWLDRESEECDREGFASQYYAMERYRKGQPQNEYTTFTVDEKNGYILYERDYNGEYMIRTEMCYWNEADGKHKLFAYNSCCYEDGKVSHGQFDGLEFYRYDNATKKMTMIEAPGFETTFYDTSYTLPRVGKDIIVNKWDENGRKRQKTLKWNGRRFSGK